MKAFLAVAVIFLLLLGCTGGNPPSNQTNVTANLTNATGNQTKPPITIIIGQQQNQTAGQNITPPVEPPPEQPPGPEFEYENDPNQTLGVYFINVGGPGLHGNSILIKKGDLDVLIDAGPVESGGKVVDFLRSKSVDDIDLLISTSADPRNYGGINAVADVYTIENYWWGDDSFGDADYSAISERMAANTKNVTVIEKGYNATLNGIVFEALNPQAQRFQDINNDAMVLRITDRNFSMLLTSNIQTGAQGKLTNEQPDKLNAEVMQAPYYGVGSGTSNIGIFLLTAKPKAMIITGSADESAANGGSRDPFRRLMNMSQYGFITYYEVYKTGNLRVASDGQNYTIQPVGG